MIERGFEPEYSPAAEAQVQRLSEDSFPTADRKDLRHLLWCSIDNDDSRDLDQLTVADGDRLLVAVADVDAAVTQGSALDARARTNTTSVYTAGGVFPMLPEKLSTDLTSLNPAAERLAVVVAFSIDSEGAVHDGDIVRARVLNHAKLAYNAVAAWLDGAGPMPPAMAAAPGVEGQLRRQDAAAQAMKARRHRRGALTLESLEARAVFDGDVLADLRPDSPNRAKQLIEDFMIAANGVAARYLAARGLPVLRRVLRTPERWDRIVVLAADHGGRLPATPDAAALAAFLSAQRTADPERFPDLSLATVKLLGKGEYVVNGPDQPPTGHFALAVRDYTHSTAPNRRFPDLITQRLIKSALAERAPAYGVDELDGLARHCTEQEDDAAKVERQVRKSAAALLVRSRIGELFDAIVTGSSDKGTWARVRTPPIEGKLVKGDRGLDVGDRVRVRLVDVDIERGYIDFQRAG